MGDKNIMDDSDEVMRAFDEVFGNLSPHREPKTNEGNGDSSEDPDCSIDDKAKALHQAKYGDEVYYEPYAPKPPRGSVEDIQHRLRTTDFRLRRELNHSLRTNPEQWTALRRPASLHTAQRTLAEMLTSIPSADQEQFHELGDGYVYMPLTVMEKYLYPTCNATLTQPQGPIRLHPRRSRIDDSVFLLPPRNRDPTKSNRTRP